MSKKLIIIGFIIFSCLFIEGCGVKLVLRKSWNTDSTSPTQEFTIITPTAVLDDLMASSSQFNPDLIKWLKDTTSIPPYLPSDWDPVKQEETDQKYYLEVLGDDNSYSINVYQAKCSIKFNDNNDLLNNNGPVSESDFVGNISGGIYDAEDFTYDIPVDAEGFEIFPGVQAYRKDDGCAVWWEENGWMFDFIGTSDLHTLENLAMQWSYDEISVSKSGYVHIVSGNRLTFQYIWEKDGYQYSYTTYETNYDEVLRIVNSFISIKFPE